MLKGFFRPTDIRSLAAFRIIFGSMMVLAMVRYFIHGWIDVMYVEPQFFFPYEGFEWVRPWPGIGMHLHYAALTVLALCIAAGIAYRTSITLFFVAFTYANLIDKTLYLNHYYLVSLIAFLMIFMPLGRAWSFEVHRRPERRLETVPQWTIWLLRFQLSVVYVFAGIAKLNADWLLRAQPLKLWLSTQGEVPILGPMLASVWVPYIFSWAGAIFDLTIVFFLLSRRTRLVAYLIVAGFHVMTGILFPIGLFPWIMIGFTTIYFEPDWPGRTGRRFGWGSRRVRACPLVQAPERIPRAAVLGLLGIWTAIQLAVPLRFLTRSGDVNWAEDGFRFAWRVMLIEKRGAAMFETRDVATGTRNEIEPGRYLTPMQVHMMATQPDMILQFAHWLADQEQQRGHPVEVRARVDVTLNGRPHQALVDPGVDLASIAAGKPVSEWISPLRERSLVIDPDPS